MEVRMAIRYLSLELDFLQGSDAIWQAIMQGLHPQRRYPVLTNFIFLTRSSFRRHSMLKNYAE